MVPIKSEQNENIFRQAVWEVRRKIEAAELHDSIFVVLSDRSAFTVYTEVSATLSCYQAQQIERVTNASDQIVLHLSGNASVTISTDRQRFSDVVELFVYHDDDGYVVEN
ncbi:hypothetical protein [Mesorhizobium sp.]|uniref:hypothetical protein n=1 Tax=Mesorhizobium sp. TaxID=1871066 RepID=UPI000FE5AEDD|nr:hypothetical protein [Mesorhizobium sp.]RWD81304.1 MAG: hypothetical protein EOS48_16580 [Mesorhizobium sp.]